MYRLTPFPFQEEIIAWSLSRDCSAIFADTGLGKALMQLRWAQARGSRRSLASGRKE